MKKILLFFCLISIHLQAQKEDFFKGFQAIKHNSYTLYNVNATTISVQSFSYDFTKRDLKRLFRKLDYNYKKVHKRIDESLDKQHYWVKDSTQVFQNNYIFSCTYFVKNGDFIAVIYFSNNKPLSSQFKNKFITSYLENKIPSSIYLPIKIDSINFVNRSIKLGPSCKWMGVRNVQCPYNGQMDWSIHASLEEAKSFNLIREQISTYQNKLSVTSKNVVTILFEGKPTQATKVVYKVKGVNSLLLNLSSGAKRLTVYYIAEKLRGKYVSCILSHWNNDKIQTNGLPSLLSEVMQLQQ